LAKINAPEAPDTCLSAIVVIVFRAVTDAKQRPGLPPDPPSQIS
jgi:hypothetical protein